MPSLTKIESDLNVEQNDALVGLDGLGALEDIEGSLRVIAVREWCLTPSARLYFCIPNAAKIRLAAGA